MKLTVKHPSGSTIDIQGRPRLVKTLFAEWWNSATSMMESGETEERGPSGSHAEAERAWPRFYESEGIHQDVPIVQAKQALGFAPNPLKGTV